MVSVSETIVSVCCVVDEPPGPLTERRTTKARVEVVVFAKLRTTGVPVAVVEPGFAMKSKSHDVVEIEPVDVLVNVMFVASYADVIGLPLTVIVKLAVTAPNAVTQLVNVNVSVPP